MNKILIGAVMGALVGCQGLISDPGESIDGPRTDPRPPEAVCGEIGVQPLRRLSSEQYENVVRDLFPGSLGTTLTSMSSFPATEIDSGFANDAEANTVNTTESNAIEDSAERLANHLLDNAATLLPQTMSCVDPGYGEADVDGCIDRFIAELGLKAHRRPLTTAEAGIARGIYDRIRASQGAEAGWASVVQFFLQSPALLYRTERGLGDRGVVALDDYEMATRLSFFFLNSIPDDALFAAAAAGELRTRDQIEAQARRLVQEPRALASIEIFHRDWLRLHHLDSRGPDDPAFDAALRDSMLAETGALVRQVIESGDGSFQTLMTTRTLPVDGPLSAIYGAGSGGPGEFSATDVSNRHGLLTQAGVLTAHGASNPTNSPIHRGAFIREEVLCNALPPFPDNLDTTSPLEAVAAAPTARDRLSPTLERAECAACHQHINDLGYPFEQYDVVGRFRTEENGATIDPSGSIAIGDAQGDFADATGLIDVIANSEQAQHCYATQMFRYANGRREAAGDTCVVDTLGEEFVAAGGDIRELLVQVALTDAFLYRARNSEDM